MSFYIVLPSSFGSSVFYIAYRYIIESITLHVDDPDQDLERLEDSDSFQEFSNMYGGFTRAYKKRLKKLYEKKVK